MACGNGWIGVAAGRLRRALAGLWLAAALAGPVLAQPVALVVGNADHAHLPAIPGAREDAQAVAATLRGAGFRVALMTDVSLPVLRATLGALGGTGDRTAPAVVFFIGHAITLGAGNRLVPAEARLAEAGMLEAETLALDEVAAAFAGRPVVIWLDAARPSPVAPGARRLGVGAGGLAPAEPPPLGAVILAAEPGAVAPLAEGAGSALAAAFAALAGRPGQRLDALVQQVVVVVSAASAGRQVPWARIAPGAEALRLVPPAAAAPEFEIVGTDTVVEPAPPPGGAEGPVAPAAPAEAVAAPSPGPVPTDRDLDLIATLPPAERESFLDLLAAGGMSPEAVDRARQSVEIAAANLAIVMGPEAPAAPADLPRAVQAELSRLGCYRQAVDGDWGPGSRRALALWHGTRALPPPVPEAPTEEVWRALLAEPDGLCPPPPPAAAPAPRAATGPAAPRRAPAPTTRRDPVCTFTGTAVVCR